MKAIFGKWLPFFMTLLVLQIFVIIIFLIWIFQDTNSLCRSIYDFIGNNSVTLNIFNFIADNVDIISGFVIVAALLILFICLRKYQRGRAVNRLHNWARNGVVILAQYRQENAGAGDPPGENYEKVRIMVDKLMTSSNMALVDARNLGGEVNDKTKRAVGALNAIRKKLANEDQSLFDDLQTLQHDFADVMILVFEFIK